MEPLKHQPGAYLSGILATWRRLYSEKSRQVNKAFLKKVLLLLVLFLALYWVESFMPGGYDWKKDFQYGRTPPEWTPWTTNIVQWAAPFGYGVIFSATVISLALRSRQHTQSPIPVVLAVLSLPTIWVVYYMGNLDGLGVLGLLLLPIGIPLVLMKPQVAGFAILAKKSSLIAGILWLLITTLIWGFWPLKILNMMMTPAWKGDYPQDISIFPWGVLLALLLVWPSRGDEDLLMAAGSLATPHLFPYHFILLMPALGRMRWQWMLITWVISWTPILANWLGDWAWHFGNLMSVFFWLGIYLNRKPSSMPTGDDPISYVVEKARLIVGRVYRTKKLAEQ